VKTETVTLSTADGPMRTFVALPSSSSTSSTGTGKHRAVIVAQEAFGVNAHIESVCVRLANAGFVAIAPELFHRSGDGVLVEYTDMPAVMAALGTLNNAALLTDLGAAIAYAKARDDVDPHAVSLVGFCVGGFATFLGAAHFELANAVACYGGGVLRARPGLALSPIVDDIAHVRAPLLAIFGADDKSIPLDDVDTIRAQLDKSKAKHEVRVVEGAGHGFLCDARAAYVERAAIETWPVIMHWLQSA
jgi:carboxymethylenebutenolidase